jgi:hypothetical protein
MEDKAHRVPKEILVIQVLKETLDLKVLKVLKVQKVLKDPQDRQGQQVI